MCAKIFVVIVACSVHPRLYKTGSGVYEDERLTVSALADDHEFAIAGGLQHGSPKLHGEITFAVAEQSRSEVEIRRGVRQKRSRYEIRVFTDDIRLNVAVNGSLLSGDRIVKAAAVEAPAVKKVVGAFERVRRIFRIRVAGGFNFGHLRCVRGSDSRAGGKLQRPLLNRNASVRLREFAKDERAATCLAYLPG